MESKKIKKVELHVHLDGSIRPSTISEYMNISVDEAKDLLIAKDKCEDLNEYLTKFDLPVKFMQTKEELIRVAKELVEDLIEDNCIYAEIRFAPNKHTEKLSLDEVVESALAGLKSEYLKTGLILCMMRGDSFEDNKNIIDLASKYLKKGVVGIDLAGAEALFKTNDYKDLFAYAKSLNIPFTIHAGEADGVCSIEDAISFGAKRIGHGVRSIESEECLNLIKKNDILLEVCPTSNIQTNTFASINDHPIKYLKEEGVPVSINTDNRTVSNVTLSLEYDKLMSTFGFNQNDFDEMNESAIKHAFISENEKRELLEKLKRK
ncbi:MAG: adenosine deaminase [Erysipelotrichales bacterium]|nr:adenosine deaminase [Erysipelotrichales bacterium]